MATICSKVNGLPLEQSLTAFLHQSDVRANIVERPTTSQNATLPGFTPKQHWPWLRNGSTSETPAKGEDYQHGSIFSV